jgi:hypothetical protein
MKLGRFPYRHLFQFAGSMSRSLLTKIQDSNCALLAHCIYLYGLGPFHGATRYISYYINFTIILLIRTYRLVNGSSTSIINMDYTWMLYILDLLLFILHYIALRVPMLPHSQLAHRPNS